jgi:hypothetical protein
MGKPVGPKPRGAQRRTRIDKVGQILKINVDVS